MDKVVKKRDFTIEKQILPNILLFSKCPFYPLHFYATQMINPFLDSMISANHGKVEGLKPIVKSLYPVLFLYCKISFESSVPFQNNGDILCYMTMVQIRFFAWIRGRRVVIFSK